MATGGGGLRAVRKRGDRWAVEVYDASRSSRKRYVGTFGSRREAREAERLALAELAKRQPQIGGETVEGFASRWLELRPRAKESTNESYREQIKPFVAQHGSLKLAEVTVELAYRWVGEKRWTHSGLRAMFSDARRMGLVEGNPFTGLGVQGSRGRKDLEVLSVTELDRLIECAGEVWDGGVALTVQALIAMAAYTGMRPGELYGLRWSDLDLRNDEINVERQYTGKLGIFEVPKNGQRRTIVLTPPARDALLQLPRPVDSEALIFRASKGGPMSGRVLHYYWHPVRCRFGQPSMDLYELRHFCGSWLLNDLELPAQDVAHQLGHADGGALVMRLYGHPSQRLARERIKRAVGGRSLRVASLSEADRRQAEG